MYYVKSAEDGVWRKRIEVNQCPNYDALLLGNRCQGIENHRGVHWCYLPDGSFAHVHNDLDPINEEDGGGWCPPDHPDYPHPATMQSLCYKQFYEFVEITDPAEIARLEEGNVGVDDSILRPMTEVENEQIRSSRSARLSQPQLPRVCLDDG